VSAATQPAPPVPVPDLGAEPELSATDPDGRPVLLGSRCRDCGELAFPERFVCARCTGDQLEVVPLGGEGSLYSYTTIHVSSSRSTPYTLGYVDLPAGPRLLATIEAAPDALRTDLPVSLGVGDDGQWWFQPAAQEGGSR
jgi:uncharacterized OB-fold protein